MQNYTSKIFRLCILSRIYRNLSHVVVTARENEPSKQSNDYLLQEEILTAAVKNGKIPTVSEWSFLKNSILSKGKYINDVNFDAIAVGFCITHKNYDAAKSFLQFIESNQETPNLATLGKYMKLYYICHESDCSISEENESFIISLYENIKKEYKMLDSLTSENIIHALSLTKEWKECLLLLENLKITMTPSGSTYSAVAKAAFENNDVDTGWNVMDEMIYYGRLPLPFVYKSWLNRTIEANMDIDENLYRLFTFLQQNDIHPPREVTDKILTLLKPLHYCGIYSSISNKGVCQCCKKPLDEIKIDEAEFEQLKSVFMKNVIIGKNIFNKTTPEELKKFKTFISNTGPCDVVIDGLNVAYSAGTKKNSHVYGKMLVSVVRHYHQKYGKILVLGRTHMNKWPKQYMDYIRANAEVFFAQNLSQDDPFLLYATMSSGLGTNFISRDLMRGHLYLLMEPRLKSLFRRWQQVHQHTVEYVENSGKVHIRTPYPVLPTIQESEEGWHIPYVNIHSSNPPATLDPPANWLCIRKSKS